jgi:hypothetical protein
LPLLRSYRKQVLTADSAGTEPDSACGGTDEARTVLHVESNGLRSLSGKIGVL